MKRINTPRLILKAMRSSDCDGLCEVLGDPQTAEDLKSFVVDSIERAQLYIQRGTSPGDCRQYGIFERDSASFIGIIEIHVKDKRSAVAAAPSFASIQGSISAKTEWPWLSQSQGRASLSREPSAKASSDRPMTPDGSYCGKITGGF